MDQSLRGPGCRCASLAPPAGHLEKKLTQDHPVSERQIRGEQGFCLQKLEANTLRNKKEFQAEMWNTDE